MKYTKLILFDLDGTLIDSRADLTTAVNLARQDYGLPPLPQDTVITFVGNGVRKLIERALGTATDDIDAAIERMRVYYAQHLVDQTDLYPGVRAGLDDLQAQGCRMAVVTNKPEAPARRICAHLEIDRYLDTILGADSCANIKPHPEPLLTAMKSAGICAQHTWMVGDNWTDMAAGRNAAVSTCFCRYGFGNLNGQTYDVAVCSFEELGGHIVGDCRY